MQTTAAGSACESAIGTEYEFDYTGSEQTFQVSCSGTYTLETWGAQGGSSSYNTNSNNGGYGGYTKADINLATGERLYISVGGKGQSIIYTPSEGTVSVDDGTGYNGGGYANYYNNNSSQSTNNSNNQTNVDTSNKTVADVMNHSGFKYNGNYLFGIAVGTNVSKLIGNISAYNRYTGIDIKSANNQNKTNDIFKTGDKITITGSDGSKTYTAIIYGDVDGDGSISAVDYVKVKNKIIKGNSINGVYYNAADVNKDGSVDAVDYVKIKNHILGKSTITQ